MTSRAPVLGFLVCSSLLAACTEVTREPSSFFAEEAPSGEDAEPSGSIKLPKNPAGSSATSSAAPSTNDSTPNSGPTTMPASPRVLAVGGYYAGYTKTDLPHDEIDFTLVDEVTHFAVVPKADGGLDDGANVVGLVDSLDFTARVHAAGKRATLCIGGAGSEAAFSAAAKDHRATLVANIAAFVGARGYDGIDVDWEPLAAADAPSFVALVKDLRAALPNKTITAAVPVGIGGLVAPAAPSLDRIHLMSYDLSGPYQGWVTWHNSALYSGGATFASTGAELPSASDAVDDLLAAGVPASKVMLGVDHQGWMWKGGVSAPQMSWAAAPTMQPITYRRIADELLTPARAKWDDAAKVPFLTIDEPGTADDMFVSYEDARSQREKVQYAREKGLAGVFVWDIAAGYRPNQAVGLGLLKSLHDDAKAITVQ